MQTRYAVRWQEASVAVQEGNLELQEDELRLESPEAVCEIRYEGVSAVRLDRDQALVIERRDGEPIRIECAAQEALLSELAERLAGLVLAQRKTARVVVVVPIKATAQDAVRGLLAKGPPFDPEETGLDGHHVFMTEQEVVFVFEASASALRRLAGGLELVAAADVWEEHATGPARIAVEAFSWTRPDSAEGLSFAPTPGPGDSEGGDLYPP